MLSTLLQSLICFFLHVETTGAFRKPLSQKEELRCFQKMKAGDTEAREKLILHNMRLVAHIAKKYYANQIEQEDLLSIGTVGLMKAVSTFDYEKGARFATYASRCIENEMLMHFRTCRKQGDAISMGEPIDTDKDGNPLTLLDIMDDGSDIQAQVATQMQTQQLYQFLQTVLSKREAEILTYRYGLYGHTPMTQREVAKKMGISRSYVSRLEKRAIQILRQQYDQTPFSAI
jgi:RNA polymerase sporulation-specific sigma factor